MKRLITIIFLLFSSNSFATTYEVADYPAAIALCNEHHLQPIMASKEFDPHCGPKNPPVSDRIYNVRVYDGSTWQEYFWLGAACPDTSVVDEALQECVCPAG